MHRSPALVVLSALVLPLAACAAAPAPAARSNDAPFPDLVAASDARAPAQDAPRASRAIVDAASERGQPAAVAPPAGDGAAWSSAAGTAHVPGIERLLAVNSTGFKRCYDRGLQDNPELAGKVRVRIVVLPDGTADVRDEDSNLPDAGVVECIVRRWQTVDFPAPERGKGAASVVVAMTFLPSSST